MSLNLHDLERGVGTDLMRRPFFTSVINASLLRFFVESVYVSDDQDDEDTEQGTEIKTSVDDEDEEKSWLQDPGVERALASTIFILTFLIKIIGYAETAVWAVVAIIFKILKLPKVYAFEKLVLDLSVVLWKESVRHIEKSIRFQSRPGQKIPQLEATRRGYGFMAITVISTRETLTRDTLAVLRMLRYMNKTTITYWTDESVTMVGLNDDIVKALCNLEHEPCAIDLGWHRDVFEGTNFKLKIIFTQENMTLVDSHIKAIGKRVIMIELIAQFSTSNLQLVAKYLDQFAAVCEASERGRRSFNGKRTLIYFVGIFVAFALIAFYGDFDEDFKSFFRPSPDVLTLAVGAFTLWMTIGKSAALGDIDEQTVLTVYGRDNILLTFHGLAKVEKNVINTTWIPEVYRDEEPRTGGVNEQVDGSLSVLEAAICLNIFEHFGHFIRWNGPKLTLERYFVQPRDDQFLGEVTEVRRIKRIAELENWLPESKIRRLG